MDIGIIILEYGPRVKPGSSISNIHPYWTCRLGKVSIPPYMLVLVSSHLLGTNLGPHVVIIYNLMNFLMSSNMPYEI